VARALGGRFGRLAPQLTEAYPFAMDLLRRDDIERAMRASPAEKLVQAVELMTLGIELRRAGIRARKPEATDAEVEQELRRWLERRD
jgi:hypothetical protein